MEATVSEPCRWEISKLSMRRGGSGSPRACSSASTMAFELGFRTRNRCSKEWRAFFSTSLRKACLAPRCGIRISTRLRGGPRVVARSLVICRSRAENFLQDCAVLEIHRHVDGARQIRGVQIELFEQRRQKFSGFKCFQVFPVEIAPVHDAAAPQMEKIDGHQRRLGVPCENVCIIARGGGDFLPLLNFGERAQKIAVGASLFVALGIRSLLHAGLETFYQVVAAAFEEHFRVASGFRVAFFGSESWDAWTMAPANVILQTGPRMRAHQVHRAGGN